MDRSRVAIVIPAYNEERTIAEVIRGVISSGTPIVVDDHSCDQTASIAEVEGAVVVRHLHDSGYDAALNLGFSKAVDLGVEYIVTLDADGQHDPTLIAAYLQRLEESADLVVGIRPQKPRLAERVFGCVTTMLYGIRDPLCGMKGYRITLYRALGHFDSYRSVGTELMLFAARNKYTIDQFEVPISDRGNGSSRFGQQFEANKQIFRALFIGLIGQKLPIK